MKEVYITGHRNPDTDSICSSIAYANYKQHFNINAVPVRIGKINKETAFVLDYFKVDAPEYLETVRTQVSDLDMDEVKAISPDYSVKIAWEIMKKNKLGILPVADKNNKLLGIVSVTDIANTYINMPENNVLFASRTPLKNIVMTLDAELICGSQKDCSNSGKVVIAAMTPDEMGPFVEKGDIVFVGNRKDSQKKAIEMGADCIIITCGSNVDKEIVDYAKEKKCVIIVTNYDTFKAARLIYQSIPVSYSMTKDNIISFNINDFVDTISEKMLQTRYRSYPIVDDNNVIKGFISRYHLINKRRKNVILVDHGEKSQTVDGLEQADLKEIIDHHRLGDIQTSSPIYYRNEPIGSTATIIAQFYFSNNVEVPKKIAGLLCAAILSDTLKFKSPTCTPIDETIARRLAKIAEIDIDDFMMEMLKASSSLKDMSMDEILHYDFKEFVFGDVKVGVGQVNSTDKEYLNKIKPDMVEYFRKVSADNNYSALLLLVTDVINEGSEVVYVENEKAIISRAFNLSHTENSAYLDGVVSRKKQIVPKIGTAAQN